VLNQLENKTKRGRRGIGGRNFISADKEKKKFKGDFTEIIGVSRYKS